MNILKLNRAQELNIQLIGINADISSLSKIAMLLTEKPNCTTMFTIAVREKQPAIKEKLAFYPYGISPVQEMLINQVNGDGWKNDLLKPGQQEDVRIIANDTDVYQMLDVALAILEGRKLAIKVQLQGLGVTL